MKSGLKVSKVDCIRPHDIRSNHCPDEKGTESGLFLLVELGGHISSGFRDEKRSTEWIAKEQLTDREGGRDPIVNPMVRAIESAQHVRSKSCSTQCRDEKRSSD